VKQKVTKNLGVILKIRKNLPQNVLRCLYFSLIHPYYEYCNIVWAINRTTVLNDLFVTQKKALRIITNSDWNCHTKPLFDKLHILSIFSLNDFQVGCLMFCATHSLLPKYFWDMFVYNSDIHEYDTRYKADVHSTHHRLNCLTFSIRIYGPTLWNSLAIDLRNVSAYHIFRNRYKHILLTE